MVIWSAEVKELEVLQTSIKSHSSVLEKELEQLIKTDDTNVVMLYSRRCLEVIITDLCECELKRPRKTEPLKGIIDKLNQEEKVPSNIIASMHSLNTLSTFGAHPKDYEPEQVKPVLNNLTTILKWYLKYKTEKASAKEEMSQMSQKGKKSKGGDRVQGKEEELQVKGYPDKSGQGSGKKSLIIILGIVIIAVIAYVISDQFNFFRKDKFEAIKDPEGKISIAVMPFENLSGDTTLNWFQRGISSLIINGLGNSSELAVRDDHTMFEIMESMNQVYTAGVSPSVARDVARKAHARTYISGSFQGREGKYWILVNLVDTENGEIIWGNKVQGDLKTSGYLDMADSLCNEIKNYLEIKALEENADYDFREAYPKSAEAYRYFIEGMNHILAEDYEPAIQSLKKSVEIDTGFTFASFYIAFAYNYNSQNEGTIEWTKKAYAGKDRLPYKFHPILEIWYACFISNNQADIIKYCMQFEETGIESRLLWLDLGVTYMNFTDLYEKAVEAFDKVMQISMERGGYWNYDRFYTEYGWALHLAGHHEKEKEINDIGLSINPENTWCQYHQAICNVFRGDSLAAQKSLQEIKSKMREYNFTESAKELWLGHLYYNATDSFEAEKHYRNAYNLDINDRSCILNLAGILIVTEINVEEGMELVAKALALNPADLAALSIKGLGLFKQGNYEEAVNILKQAEEKWTGFNNDIHKELLKAEQALANQNKSK